MTLVLTLKGRFCCTFQKAFDQRLFVINLIGFVFIKKECDVKMPSYFKTNFTFLFSDNDVLVPIKRNNLRSSACIAKVLS